MKRGDNAVKRAPQTEESYPQAKQEGVEKVGATQRLAPTRLVR